MDCLDIKSKFVDYYQQLGFQFLPRAPMLHPSIPMSFVMSAGLVQVETSLAKSKNRSSNKFILVQDCYRHFDLNTVGTDDTHLSLFEMPGAFVFSGDGKFQAIYHMWKLATEILGINPNHIWASYFNGDNTNGLKLECDELTKHAWLDLGLPKTKVIGLGVAHNYWLQGTNGIQSKQRNIQKCGPHTELFYDRGIEKSCGSSCTPGCKCGRFIEFSNSLFISYEYNPEENHLKSLEDPFIETVIGTERIAMILQGVESVFDIKKFNSIINYIQNFITNTDLPIDIVTTSKKIIADYIRALYLLVSDGAPPPGKNGRERIIKLIIRGILTRQIILGIRSNEFLPTIIKLTEKTFHNKLSPPDINIIKYYNIESQRFMKTIERGKRKMELMISGNQTKTLSNIEILELETKWGIPKILCRILLKEKGISIVDDN